jgi:hypothetical protein
VGTGAAQVRQDVSVVATGIFKGVGENDKAIRFQGASGKDALVGGSLGQGQHGGRSPGSVEGDGAEGVAEDTAEERGLRCLLCGEVGARSADLGAGSPGCVRRRGCGTLAVLPGSVTGSGRGVVYSSASSFSGQ